MRSENLSMDAQHGDGVQAMPYGLRASAKNLSGLCSKSPSLAVEPDNPGCPLEWMESTGKRSEASAIHFLLKQPADTYRGWIKSCISWCVVAPAFVGFHSLQLVPIGADSRVVPRLGAGMRCKNPVRMSAPMAPSPQRNPGQFDSAKPTFAFSSRSIHSQ